MPMYIHVHVHLQSKRKGSGDFGPFVLDFRCVLGTPNNGGMAFLR